ncbi:hypothetical protein D1B17_11195 [Companilactobacillus zhachilii]|uniref:Uncharacterized protein n=1 Tax=Companilactobacillus zhachilii TaxID=2304606 RepID=A0A386PUD6_9LACO|nr:hypothetical protein [Companilactobacillus zhachilii]AYE39162.1 hypothetical protein D1B17_11195 [Companilactobacillus zhachilii]
MLTWGTSVITTNKTVIIFNFIYLFLIMSFLLLDWIYKQNLNKVKKNNKRLKLIEYKLNKKE